MFSRSFWRSAAERAIKSFAQSLLAILGISGLGLLDVDWVTTLSTAGMAMVLSVLTSLASEGVGPRDDPSLVNRAPAPVPVQAQTAAPSAAATV